MTDETTTTMSDPVPATAPATVKCVILRDFWDADGERHRAGEDVEVPVEAAFEGIEKGILARVKA